MSCLREANALWRVQEIHEIDKNKFIPNSLNRLGVQIIGLSCSGFSQGKKKCIIIQQFILD